MKPQVENNLYGKKNKEINKYFFFFFFKINVTPYRMWCKYGKTAIPQFTTYCNSWTPQHRAIQHNKKQCKMKLVYLYTYMLRSLKVFLGLPQLKYNFIKEPKYKKNTFKYRSAFRLSHACVCSYDMRPGARTVAAVDSPRSRCNVVPAREGCIL